jgi:hypothetical protein
MGNTAFIEEIGKSKILLLKSAILLLKYLH